jgi:hypothetical protein
MSNQTLGNCPAITEQNSVISPAHARYLQAAQAGKFNYSGNHSAAYIVSDFWPLGNFGSLRCY